MNDYRDKLKHITTIIFDYDGVLSDGKILFSDDGQQMRNGNVKDGYAIQLAQKMGLRVAIISGANTPGIQLRTTLLKIEDCFLGIHDKLEKYNEFKKETNLRDDEILYMGDDIPDMPVMKLVSIATCPADAVTDVKNISHYISHLNGGTGCARDIIEQVLRAQDKWLTPEAFIW
jgi:3-deoxy-D-manno-octulosonate 8-phosphate phosphatase (KDO 8-P phosphatase)